MNVPDSDRFRLERVNGSPVSDDALLHDLRIAADKAGTRKLSQRLYSEHGEFDPSTTARRFGGWNKALFTAGLEITNEINIPDDRLFENILQLWQHYGRQPRRAELAAPPSTVSWGAYRRRFRSWTNALVEFVDYANDVDASPLSQGVANIANKTPRSPSLRLRFRVLSRDNFTCCACGASPAHTPGLRLHVDHVVAWSKGGATEEANLQTLCEECNLGKSNIF